MRVNRIAGGVTLGLVLATATFSINTEPVKEKPYPYIRSPFEVKLQARTYRMPDKRFHDLVKHYEATHPGIKIRPHETPVPERGNLATGYTVEYEPDVVIGLRIIEEISNLASE